jgi:hypothetical protein
MAEPDAQLAQYAGLLFPTSGFSGSFRHAWFGATGSLYDQAMWDKYQLATMAGCDFKTNALIEAKEVPTDTAAHEDPNSVFGPAGDNYPGPAATRRGVHGLP